MRPLAPRAHPFLAVATVLLAAGATAQHRPTAVGCFPEGAAAIERVLLHFDPNAADAWMPTCRDLLRALPAAVRVTVAAQDTPARELFEQLLDQWDLPEPEIVVVGEELTSWARDRLLAIGDGQYVTLVAPRPESVAAGYAGDMATARGVGQEAQRHRFESSDLSFEGGDIACSGRRAYVGWNLIRDNSGDQPASVGIARFEELLQLPVVPVGEPSPPHDHLDMYLTVLGEDTVLLGDPELGASLLERYRALPGDRQELPENDEWTVAAQEEQLAAYERIREDLTGRGLRVLRVPILHGEGGAVLTWNNALVERRHDGARAYVPTYGLPLLDDAAVRAYRQAGFRVFPIDVAAIAENGGTVRCLTNVVEWRVERPSRVVAEPSPPTTVLPRRTPARPQPR